jgi:hypothetical protein
MTAHWRDLYKPGYGRKAGRPVVLAAEKRRELPEFADAPAPLPVKCTVCNSPGGQHQSLCPAGPEQQKRYEKNRKQRVHNRAYRARLKALGIRPDPRSPVGPLQAFRAQRHPAAE